MKKTPRKTFFFLIAVAFMTSATAQGIKMGEVIIVSTSALKKDAKQDAFKAFINEGVAQKLKTTKPGVTVKLFQADRGNRKGELLLVFGADKVSDRQAFATGSPFSDEVLSAASKRPSDFLNNTHTYTEYRLIGADKIKSLPDVGILGMHYIKVKKERAGEFEKFVVEKLHPAVAQVLPEMSLLYYKATAGEQAGTYVTIFAITSVAARDKYWPAGAPETKILKDAFKPLQELAKELGTYLEPGSYLEPTGGAAAYFESKQWTDFVFPPQLK